MGEVAWLQGCIAGQNMVMECVATASEQAKDRTEQITDRTQLKDQMLAQEEYEPRENPLPSFA